MLAGQLLILTQPPRLLPREFLILVLAALAHGTGLFLTIFLLLGLLTSLTTRGVSALIWGLVTTASSMFWLDSFGYRWLDLHLDETLTLLLWNLRGDFLVMRSKLLFVGLGVLLLLSVFAAVTAFYRATAGRFSWGCYPVPVPTLGLCLFASVLALIPLKFLMTRQVSDTVQYWFHQAEWPIDFVAPAKTSLLTINDPQFLPPPDPSVIDAQLLRLRDAQLARRPNIFLFVVESLRADALSADGAPNLFQLQQEALHISDAEANGNCTHIAWFSLFNSSSPLFWSLLAKSPERSGAVPLRMLKALGYHVSVLSTPSLHYFDTDHVLFSHDLSLADVFVDQATLTPAVPGCRARRSRSCSDGTTPRRRGPIGTRLRSLLRCLSRRPAPRLFVGP